MHKAWVLLLFGGLMLALAAYFRRPLLVLFSRHSCNSFTQVCVACPHLTSQQIPAAYPLVEISHTQEFIVISSRQTIESESRECSDFMALVDEGRFVVKEEELYKIVHPDNVTIRNGELSAWYGRYFVSQFVEEDMLVFYRSKDYKKVLNSVEHPYNLASVSVLSRLIPLSMLFGFFLRWSLQLCGWSPTLSLRDFSVEAWVLGLLVWSGGNAEDIWWLEGMVCACLMLRTRDEPWSGLGVFGWAVLWQHSWVGAVGKYGAVIATLWTKQNSELVRYYRWVGGALAVCLLWSYAWESCAVWWFGQVMRAVQLPCLLLSWPLATPSDRKSLQRLPKQSPNSDFK